MKIVSKYKDFYDFIIQDNDPDLTYVRDMNIVNQYYDNLIPSEHLGMPYFNKYYGYSYDDYYKNREAGELEIFSVIFGIYPYVYSQPILKIHYRTITDIQEYDIFVLSKDIINSVIVDGDTDKLIKYAQNELNKLCENHKAKYAKVLFSGYNNTPKNIKSKLERHTWKFECKELFEKIKAPIFTKYYEWLYNGGVYWEKIYNTTLNNIIKHYITNISFKKLNYNILKYWYDELNDLNTYIAIENFLWSIKQEPIANPDNKTKIVSHGFDLKTSFRNM